MLHFEGLSLSDAIWVTATTITTVGYGDVSAKTDLGRLSTVSLLYVGGIFVLGSAVSAGLEIQQQRLDRKRRGEWRWKLHDHIVFISPRTGLHEEFVESVVSELRTGGDKRHVLLLSIGASDRSYLPFERLDVAVVRVEALDPAALLMADVADAAVIVALDDEHERSSAFQVDAVSQARYVNADAQIICEVASEHADRARHLGASSVVRRTRGYPAMLAREILAPHSGAVLEELFSSKGATLVRVDLPSQVVMTWPQVITVATRVKLGVPVALVNATGQTIVSPELSSQLAYPISGLYVISSDALNFRRAKARAFVRTT